MALPTGDIYAASDGERVRAYECALPQLIVVAV
jgi:hypothetical protein